MKLHLKIIEADNIPKMDLFGKADPFVTVHLSESKDSAKTNYIPKTYNPKWNAEMHLRVASISETVTIELKDHDPAGKVDLIGTIERSVKQFPPGVITNEWITVRRAKGAKKTARIHIISHLALEGLQPFVQMPFQFLKVCVNVISATDIEKMDTVGKTDPYVVIWIQSCPSIKHKTSVLKNNMNPRWNEEFTIEVLNQTNDILSFKMWDKDVLKDDEMATLDIPLGQFQLFDIIEKEYEMKPVRGVKKGGKIKLKLQVIPINEQKWKTGVAVPVVPGQEQQMQSIMNQLQSMQSSMMQSSQSQMNQTAPKPVASRQLEPDINQQTLPTQQGQFIQGMPVQQGVYPQVMPMQSVMYNQGMMIQQGMCQQTMPMQPMIYNQGVPMQQGFYPQQGVPAQQGIYLQPEMYPQAMQMQSALYSQGIQMQQAMYPQQMMMQQEMYNQGQIPPSI